MYMPVNTVQRVIENSCRFCRVRFEDALDNRMEVNAPEAIVLFLQKERQQAGKKLL